jgi:hypothetical protein
MKCKWDDAPETDAVTDTAAGNLKAVRLYS